MIQLHCKSGILSYRPFVFLRKVHDLAYSVSAKTNLYATDTQNGDVFCYTLDASLVHQNTNKHCILLQITFLLSSLLGLGRMGTQNILSCRAATQSRHEGAKNCYNTLSWRSNALLVLYHNLHTGTYSFFNL